MEMLHFHLDTVYDIAGFSPINVKEGNYFWLLTSASITSDQPEFHKYITQLSNPYFNKVGIFPNAVYQFLILLHCNGSTDLYVNDFPIQIELMAKYDVKKSTVITMKDIADIRRLKFPDIEILETDRLIYCFKVGWKFGLFFNLDYDGIQAIDDLALTLGKLYRHLSFQDVYEAMESNTHFEQMKKDGWFPFIELIGGDYEALSEAYQDRFDLENRIERTIRSFDEARVNRIAGRWWRNKIFQDKKKILQAGINAFLRNDKEGNINCIKNLLSEVDGIIRFQYFKDTGESNKIRQEQLLKHLIEKGKGKSGSEYSLLLTLPFLAYLNDVIFPTFDLKAGQIDLSRHSSSHGVANADVYTRARALQALLVLDQICFYL